MNTQSDTAPNDTAPSDSDPSNPSDEAESAPAAPTRSRDDARLARSAARLAAVQALYQMEITGAPWREVQAEFETHRIGAEIEGEQYREADLALFRDLLEGVVQRQKEIDQLTDAALVKKWPLGRVDPTLRAIFRCGGYELLVRADVPLKVAITEYVDVAKAFFTSGQEARFVNGVLDHMAHQARPEPSTP